MNLSRTAIDFKRIGRGAARKGLTSSIESIPVNAVRTRPGDAGQGGIGRIAWAEIATIPADNNLVSNSIVGGESKSSARPLSGMQGRRDIPGKAHIADRRREWRGGNIQCAQYGADLRSVSTTRTHIAEKQRKLRNLSCNSIRNGSHIGFIPPEVFVQRLTIVQITQCISIQHVTVGIDSVQILPISKTVIGNIIVRRKNRPAIATGVTGPSIGKDPSIDIRAGTGARAHGHIPRSDTERINCKWRDGTTRTTAS